MKGTPGILRCIGSAAVEEIHAADVVIDLREDLVAVSPEFGGEAGSETGVAPGH